eukprot:362716-Chlamydomonas_euryale.AAC.15
MAGRLPSSLPLFLSYAYQSLDALLARLLTWNAAVRRPLQGTKPRLTSSLPGCSPPPLALCAARTPEALHGTSTSRQAATLTPPNPRTPPAHTGRSRVTSGATRRTARPSRGVRRRPCAVPM